MCDISDPSEWHSGGLPLLKHTKESNGEPGADVHGNLEIEADRVDLLLGCFTHFRQIQLRGEREGEGERGREGGEREGGERERGGGRGRERERGGGGKDQGESTCIYREATKNRLATVPSQHMIVVMSINYVICLSNNIRIICHLAIQYSSCHLATVS